MLVPPLETERLLIRAFRLEDLDVIHHILDIELRTADFGSEQARTREERERWLQWTVLSYEESARLYQPPYSDRAVVLKSTQQVIGAQALIDYAFTQLHLKRIVATTTYENIASIGVMRKVGMRIEKNPSPDPPWFQVVGILENRLTHGLQTGL